MCWFSRGPYGLVRCLSSERSCLSFFCGDKISWRRPAYQRSSLFWFTVPGGENPSWKTECGSTKSYDHIASALRKQSEHQGPYTHAQSSKAQDPVSRDILSSARLCLPKVSSSSQAALSAGDQVFWYMSVWGASYKLTTWCEHCTNVSWCHYGPGWLISPGRSMANRII